MSNPMVVCSNVIERDDAYLLVEETKSGVAGMYNFPAGTVDSESLIDCAVREAKEESGLVVEPYGLVGVYQNSGAVVFVFASDPVGGSLRTSDEHPVVSYYSYDAVKAMADELRNSYILHAVESYRDDTVYDLDVVVDRQQ